MRRACCASVLCMSIARGAAIAAATPFFVISLISTRLMFVLTSLIASAMCHAMASPSRSGSRARYTISFSRAALRISATTFFLPSMTS